MPISIRNLLTLVALLLAMAGVMLYIVPAGRAQAHVAVYTSVDAEYALPLFKRFTDETGIRVIPRTDDEGSKTTAMADRLLQMKDSPDGDVFWNSELSQTQSLAERGVFEPYVSPSAAGIPAAYKDSEGRWTGFGCRVRVLIYNTQRVKPGELPRTLEDLAEPRWKGRFVVAKPLYGTTRSHLVSLVAELGEEPAFNLFRAWRRNGLVVADSNGDVRNRVAEGIFDIGLTDTDDVFSAMDRNKPVDYVVPDQTRQWRGAFLIPNTVALLKNGPNPRHARAFIDFLLRPETEAWLAENGARQIPVRPMDVKIPERLKGLSPAAVDLAKLARQPPDLPERIKDVLLARDEKP